MTEPTIYIVDHRHYNIVWRKTLEEYGDMQEWHLLKVLEMMRNYPQYKFTMSQASVMANFIVRHYDLEQEIGARFKDGQLAVVGGASTIGDTNLVSGEALYRNLLQGLSYFRREFEHEVHAASFEGVSGISPQVPQILRNLGFKHMITDDPTGLKLECEGTDAENARSFMWEGLDGSRLPVHMPTIIAGPLRFYDEPFQETFHTKESFELLDIYKEVLQEAQQQEADQVWLQIVDEERKVDEELVDAVWEERRKKDNPKIMQMASPGDYIDAVAEQDISCLHRGETNPLHTGTYATRIELKQGSVELENMIVETEKWFTMAGTEGMHFPELKFRDLWDQIFVLQSHHAITGCVSDKVQHRLDSLIKRTRRDLVELRTRAISSICAHINSPRRDEWRPLHVFNSLNWKRTGVVEFEKQGGVQIADDDGNPVPVLNRNGTCSFLAEVPPLGYNTYWFLAGGGQQPRELDQKEFETDAFKVSFDDSGCVSITDKRNGKQITRGNEFWGEIIAKEDRGSLWCKGYTGKSTASKCTSVKLYRELLGWEIRRTGELPEAPWNEFKGCRWRQSILFYDSLPHFDLHIDLDWKGSASELRLRLPFGSFGMSSFYGVPFGAVSRVPYDADLVMKDGKSLVQGEEWPACRWVEFGDGEYGVTVAHSGTPGIKCEDEDMEISLLRSPIDDPEYSHNFYFKAEKGAHNNGHHHYRFSFMPAAGDWRTNGSFRFGYEHQNPLFAYTGPAREGRAEPKRSFLDFGPGNLVCTAWTLDRRGRQYMRIVEAAGQPTELVWNEKPRRAIHMATPFKERLESADKILFKPFEIKNIMLV